MTQRDPSSTCVLDSAGSASTGARSEMIAGYALEARIGVGGYGEVWRALGPGGFHKAVKILYGQVDGPQAETELKSLDRIRELRHPFLLNIERVEVVNSRLVVVAELADHSLLDRFNACTAEGLPGIPRDELLGYLKDAAEALDFMSQRHGLQHMDIKPENLLLQGGRAKVGDFGLAKQVTSIDQSMIRGFTPRYAPPEMLEGRTALTSDQYSLAIVYMMMLTGVPPFNGRTPAQLTVQHLKSAPELSHLHPSDRVVISRALSKNPESRFGTCREFVDELCRRRPSESLGGKPTSTAVATDHRQAPSPASDGGTSGSRTPMPVASRAALPINPGGPLKVEASVRPVMLIGVGGMGCKVVAAAQKILADTFDGASLPAVQCICIDTDRDALVAIHRDAQESPLPDLHTLAVPLRSTQEYRRTGAEHLHWLNRRWLFNIPRSGNVEGMRPLGRLAFIDHRPRESEFLNRQLRAALDKTSAATTQEQSGLPVACVTPDIYLIGTTCGGTASGMLLDTGMLVRSLLGQAGHHNAQINGILLHTGDRQRQPSELHNGNTVSFLQELLHYNSSPEHTDDARPFDECWFLPVTVDAGEATLQIQLNQIASFLQLRTLSSATNAVRKWSAGGLTRANHPRFSVRTMGLESVNQTAWETESTNSAAVAFRLIHEMLQEKELPASMIPAALLTANATAAENLGLNPQRPMDFVGKLMTPEIQSSVASYAASIADRVMRMPADDFGTASVVDHIAALLTADSTAPASGRNSIGEIIRTLKSGLDRKTQAADVELGKALAAAIDTTGRLNGGRWLLNQLRIAANATAASCKNQLPGLRVTFEDFCNANGLTEDEPGSRPNPEQLHHTCEVYVSMLVCQTTLKIACEYYAAIAARVTQKSNSGFQPLRSCLSQIATQLVSSYRSETSVTEQLVSQFNQYLAAHPTFRLSSVFQDNRSAAETAQHLLQIGRSFLEAQQNSVHQSTQNRLTSKSAADTKAAVADGRNSAAPFSSSVKPKLVHVGGEHRVVTLLPPNTDADHWMRQLRSEFGDCIDTIHHPGENVTTICEVRGISLQTLIDLVAASGPQVKELAKRLHSRTDIRWP